MKSDLEIKTKLEMNEEITMEMKNGNESNRGNEHELGHKNELEMNPNFQIVIRNLTDEQKTELKEALEEYTKYGAIKLPSTALLEVKPMIVLGQQKRNHELDIVKIFKITNNEATDLVAETERVFEEINFKFPTHCYDNSLKGNGELIPYPHTTESILDIASDEDLIGSSRPFNKVLNSEIIINVYCLLCDIPSPTWRSMQRRNPFA